MKIYTKSGDKGMTSIIGGQRLKKSSPRVRAYGSTDEINAWVETIIAELDSAKFSELIEELTHIQYYYLMQGQILLHLQRGMTGSSINRT